MEGKAEFTSTAVTVYGASNIPDGHPAAADTAAPVNPTISVEGPSMAAFPPPVNVPPFFQPSAGNPKRKRGRPRKYGPDYSNGAVLSPVPISAIPLPPEFPPRKQEPTTWLKPNPAEKRESKSESETPDDSSTFQRCRNFTLHIITVNAGEDVSMKIVSDCPKSRAITIISANGSISLVTIRRPDVAGGKEIYEGHFDIVSLNGLFMPMKNGSLMSMFGGLSVNLVDGGGKTVAGGLAGMLIAESSVMVTVGSFLPNGSNQRKRKRAETEPSSSPSPTMGPPRDKAPMGPPRDKEPMNPNGGQMPNFSPASSSQAGPSAQHGSSQAGPLAQHGPSQENRDLGTENRPSDMMLLGEINGNGESWFMKSG